MRSSSLFTLEILGTQHTSLCESLGHSSQPSGSDYSNVLSRRTVPAITNSQRLGQTTFLYWVRLDLSRQIGRSNFHQLFPREHCFAVCDTHSSGMRHGLQGKPGAETWVAVADSATTSPCRLLGPTSKTCLRGLPRQGNYECDAQHYHQPSFPVDLMPAPALGPGRATQRLPKPSPLRLSRLSRFDMGGGNRRHIPQPTDICTKPGVQSLSRRAGAVPEQRDVVKSPWVAVDCETAGWRGRFRDMAPIVELDDDEGQEEDGAVGPNERKQ